MEFNPERFLGEDPEPDPRGAVFGFGRRICECCRFIIPSLNERTTNPPRLFVVCTGPGLNIAQTSLWLTCAMSLAVLDVEKYVDGSGSVVEPGSRYRDGIIR